MKKSTFKYIKENAERFVKQEVFFEHYVPSADKVRKAKGFIVGFGEERPLTESILIAESGTTFKIHYTNVRFIETEDIYKNNFFESAVILKTESEKELQMIEEIAKSGISLAKTKEEKEHIIMEASHRSKKLNYEISAIENAVRELQRK